MDCAAAREALSASLDDEADLAEVDVAELHAEGCSACGLWAAEVARVTRRLRLRPAEGAPDLVGAVLHRVQAPRAPRIAWARWALALVALTELVLALPRLFGGPGGPGYDSRHLGSFGSAVALGLAYVAWRPHRAYGVLPILSALALTMTVAAALDITLGRVSALGEVHHGLELAGLLLVWHLAGRPVPRLPRLFRAAAHAGRIRTI